MDQRAMELPELDVLTGKESGVAKLVARHDYGVSGPCSSSAAPDGFDTGEHFFPGRRIGRVDMDRRRCKTSEYDGLFDPEHHVLAGAALVVAQVVVEAQFANRAGLQQGDGLVRPEDSDPAVECLASSSR
jgi:hypothetical protein